jgi:beta-mannosidase
MLNLNFSYSFPIFALLLFSIMIINATKMTKLLSSYPSDSNLNGDCEHFSLYHKIDLTSSQKWTLTNSKLNINIENFKIPNSVHSLLHEHRIIDDPLSNYNDVNLKWIANDNNWIFKTEFKLNDKVEELDGLKKILRTDNFQANLHLESIDTVSYVYLNDRFVAHTNNQFLKYELNDIDSFLNFNNTNVLEIRFKSPVKHAKELAAIYPYRVPAVCPPRVQNGECHVNFLRKEQCSFR